ncbi:MAG TPA: HAD family phosphatase [Candidatus Sulfopaludibacter sp.]|nr:HAD family phosphatase [Candidatus Sulfopaludibacter sp.]
MDADVPPVGATLLSTGAYRAVIFDLGKVLVHFDFKRGYRALEGLCPYPAEEIPRRLSTTGLVEQFETGLVEPHDFFAQLSAILDLKIDYAHFCRIWSCIFTEPLVPESMLEGLARRYRLVLLSNTNAIHFDMIRETYGGLLRHFHALVLSYEAKAMKPARAIFERAVEAAGCRPEECFYTDDIAAYIEAARTLGIDAVQFESAEQIQRELTARGIEW